MKKYVSYALLWLLFALISLNHIQAQEVADEPHKLRKFVTFDVTALSVGSFYNTYGGMVGYEQFLTPKLSVVGGMEYTYRQGRSRGVITNLIDYSHEVSVSAGLRYRLLTGKRLNVYAEGRVGYTFERVTPTADALPNQPYSNSWMFAELGLGLEYQFSDRVKGTLGIGADYNARYGIGPFMRLGAQIRLGK